MLGLTGIPVGKRTVIKDDEICHFGSMDEFIKSLRKIGDPMKEPQVVLVKGDIVLFDTHLEELAMPKLPKI